MISNGLSAARGAHARQSCAGMTDEERKAGAQSRASSASRKTDLFCGLARFADPFRFM
jgi:hypothetical protein